jgi:cytochrome c-type biogenesis protein
MDQVQDVSVLFAFLGGVISFLSPCVLPLVPGYFSMLSGISVEQLRQGHQPKSGLFASALSFVTGLSVVLILLFGASATAVGIFLQQNRTLLDPLAGALILLFGLHLLGGLIKMNVRAGLILGGVLVALGIAALLHHGPLFLGLGASHFFALSLIGLLGPKLARWLNQDVHIRDSGKRPGLLRGFVLGFAFAFGWSPCLGPILAGVLALASQSGTLPRAMFLMAVYSAGLAIPFLLTALGFEQFLRFYQNFRKHLHAVEVFSGILLLFIGGLIFFNKLTWLAGKFGFMRGIALWLEHAVTGLK